VKAIDPVGSAIKFGEYFEAFGMHFFVPASLVLGIVLAVAELMIGLCFLLGLRMKVASVAALLFMLFFTGLTYVLARTNAVEDCGCFGDAIKLDNWQTFYKNLIILPFVIYIFIERKNYTPLLHCILEWLVFALLLGCAVALPVYCYKHLPLIDFMPYKVGAKRPAGMIMPDDAPQDVYAESVYIYEKDGEQKTFTIDSLPDSTWTFVDTPAPKLLKRGYVPPTGGFSIKVGEEGTPDIYETVYVYHKDNEIRQFMKTSLPDSTWIFVGVDSILLKKGYAPNEVIHGEIFAQGGYLMFVTSEDLQRMQRGKSAQLNELYDFAQRNGVNFMMLTGSADDASKTFAYETGAQYPIYGTDATIIKTMLRSNPGVMLLNDSVVLRKWSYADLPSTDEIAQLLATEPQKIIESYENDTKRQTILVGSVVFALFILASLKLLWRKK
jgi:uncharacterized membrane protein YphA (DoxX/SURF4 family)